MQWTTACPDWEQKLRLGQSIIPAPLFPQEAEAGLAVLRELKIVDAPGSPTIGESCAEWVFDFAGAIFGAYDYTTGRRMISEYMLCIPKKNSKSTIAAGIMLTALIRNWRLSAEFIILAPTKEIADNSFKPAADMVKHDEELRDLMHVQPHLRTITHRETGATLKVVAADGDTVGGKKAVGVLIDEAWLFGKNVKAPDIIREATGGLASRPEGFVIWLTTQSNEPPAGVFREKLKYSRAVRDGRIDDNQFLPVIYEFPQAMIKSGEARLVENFHLVNPNMGFSVDEAFLLRSFKMAQEAGEEELRGFLAKHANIEVGLALLSERWAGADFWEVQGKRPGLSFDDLLRQCEVIDIGIDGGGLDDLLGFAAVGRHRTTREWLLWTHAWAHPSVLTRRQSVAANFHDFAKDKNLTLVDQIGHDVEQVANLVSRVEQSGLLDKVGLDPAGSKGDRFPVSPENMLHFKLFSLDGTDAFSGMNDALYNFVTTGKLSFSDMAATFASSALKMLIQWGTAQVAMAALNAFTSTAAIPIVGPFAAPAAAASALGAAGSFMGMIGSVAGMAHDGIDAVPETGTWLIQKGERVTTAQTSAKLDRTLEQVSRGGGGGGNVQIHNYSNSQVSAKRDENGQLQVIIKAVEEHLVSGMLSGAGDLRSATQSAFNLKNGVS